jgi:Holliday junction DNA helicase RuvA
MISSLRGTILSIAQTTRDSLVIETGGVGFRVLVPGAVLDEVEVGRAAFLHTLLIVREDALTLYGFANEEQRAVFELLLTVQGVGPKVALSVLSFLSLDVLRHAIAREQPEVLSRVRGVGKKTAEKIVFTLKDKLGAEFSLGQISAAGEIDTEAIAALTALGYSIVEAQAAMQAIPKGEGKTVEERIRLALQYFAA